jgi:hypothetical protein
MRLSSSHAALHAPLRHAGLRALLEEPPSLLAAADDVSALPADELIGFHYRDERAAWDRLFTR